MRTARALARVALIFAIASSAGVVALAQPWRNASAAGGGSDQADIRPTYESAGVLSDIPPPVWVMPVRPFTDGVLVTWINQSGVPIRCVATVKKPPAAIESEGISLDEVRHMSCWRI